jgi:hypothetical protein
MAVVNGELKGFEIKSDQDTLHRLRSQVSVYGKIFDTVTIMTGLRHIRRAKKILPSWWRILLADRKSDSTPQLECLRQDRLNPKLDPFASPGIPTFALIQLIWRDQAFALLRIHNLHTAMKQKVDAAIEALQAQGYTVRPYNREGTFWFAIDGRMLGFLARNGRTGRPGILTHGIGRPVPATAKRRTEQLRVLDTTILVAFQSHN